MKRKVQNTKFQTPNTNKGITLIALVITIIVLLILAGVAINMAIDSNGLFGKANEAVESWNTAVENESTAVQELLNELGISGGGDEPPALPAGWDSAKVSAVVTEGTRKAPVPKGFTASQIGGAVPENTISGGLVIYQIPEDANVDWTASTITIGEATTNLQETVNQFVWIPVDDVNQMVMCKKNNKEEGSYVENEETITTKICKLELVKNEETNKEELVCKTHNNSTDLCGRLYGTGTNTSTTPYTTSMNFSDRTQTWSDTDYREPDVLESGYDNDSNTGNLATFTTQMTSDFINMATSVAKYGGFYVSRYEAGANGASLKNQKPITAASSNGTVYQGVNKWYGLYNAVRKEIAVGTSTMQSHMIYGSQYDQIINFIGSEAQTGHTYRQLATQQKTGYANDIMKNIYDLEGNNWEWTAQAYSTSNRVHRGGNFFNAYYGSFVPASCRGNDKPTDTYDRSTTRPSLYL